MKPLEQVIERVAGIAAQFQITALDTHLDVCRALVRLGARLEVDIVGGFKAGKSSFLNVLAQQPVLPVGVLPVTAVVTRLSYGPREQVTVHYRDQRTQQIPLDQVRLYVAESENPENQKNVASVAIELPTLKPYEGLSLVDTPGLGAVFQNNTEASLNWLPSAGVVLVAISADRPLSEQDVSLIRELHRFTPRMAILLTKADLLDERQLDEVQTFIRQQVQRLCHLSLPIFPFSIRDQTNRWQQRLHDDLLGPIAASQGEAMAEILRHKLSNLLTEAADYLALGLAATAREQSERTRLRERVLGEKTGFEMFRRQLGILVHDSINNTLPSLLELLQRHQSALHQRLIADFQARSAEWRMNLWRYTRAYERWLKDSLRREWDILSISERQNLLIPLSRAQQHLARTVDHFRLSLAERVERTLGVKIFAGSWEGQVSEPQKPDVSISTSFDSQIDLLWFLIPMTVFRSLVERHFRHRLSLEVKKNLSRLAAQWAESINRRIRELAVQAETLVHREISTIENLLAAQSSKAPALEGARLELLREKERLTDRSALT